MKKITQTFVLLAVLATTCGLACHPAEKSGLAVVTLTIDGQAVEAEVANREATRMAGLMFRREMGKNHGMIFIFPDSQIRAFWMKNTVIPLSIAYIDSRGVILNILEMPPETEDSFYSKGNAQYALEMNSGWYKARGIQAGDRVEGLKAAPTAVP